MIEFNWDALSDRQDAYPTVVGLPSCWIAKRKLLSIGVTIFKQGRPFADRFGLNVFQSS